MFKRLGMGVERGAACYKKEMCFLTWFCKDISDVQVLSMSEPTLVTCQLRRRCRWTITNHPRIEPNLLVVEGHVLNCPDLGGIAPPSQLCPPCWGRISQVGPSIFHFNNSFMLGVHRPGTCKHQKTFIFQVSFCQMPRT